MHWTSSPAQAPTSWYATLEQLCHGNLTDGVTAAVSNGIALLEQLATCSRTAAARSLTAAVSDKEGLRLHLASRNKSLLPLSATYASGGQVRANAYQEAGWTPTWTLTEDFALGMEMKRNGWHCRYLNQYLAVGEVQLSCAVAPLLLCSGTAMRFCNRARLLPSSCDCVVGFVARGQLSKSCTQIVQSVGMLTTVRLGSSIWSEAHTQRLLLQAPDGVRNCFQQRSRWTKVGALLANSYPKLNFCANNGHAAWQTLIVTCRHHTALQLPHHVPVSSLTLLACCCCRATSRSS